MQPWLWEETGFPRLHIMGGRALPVTPTSSLLSSTHPLRMLDTSLDEVSFALQ